MLPVLDVNASKSFISLPASLSPFDDDDTPLVVTVSVALGVNEATLVPPPPLGAADEIAAVGVAGADATIVEGLFVADVPIFATASGSGLPPNAPAVTDCSALPILDSINLYTSSNDLGLPL